jgi:uncharacterized protein YcbK (DUF882 family)
MVTARRRGAGALALVLMVVGSACAAWGQAQGQLTIPNPPNARQSLPNERTLSLRHRWTHEQLNIVYRIGNGYQADALAALNWLLRDYRCNKYTTMHPKLFDLLYELQEELQPRGPIQIVSGYRSEGYNASLLRAGRTVDPDSQHTLGRAVDVIFPGVPADRVRAAAEAKGLGGVGYYPFSGPVFVHVDTGPVRHWAEPDPRVRRVMGVPVRRRSRLSLDCGLTTDQVLEQISPDQAYAALPPGAASKPHPANDVAPASLAAGTTFQQLMTRGNPGIATPANVKDGDGPSCVGSDPLSRLALLQPAPKLPVMLKTARTRLKAKTLLRQQAKTLLRQKVKRQVKVARRAVKKPNHIAVEDRGALTRPEWEKLAF